MENPSVLVVIPLYNASPYVAQAVNSILTQTYPNFRLLVIDDGSADGGDEIVAQMQNPQILLWHQANSGPGSAMNRAIEFAMENNIPLIARMDADDISLPNRLRTQVNLLNSAGPTTVACSSNCYYIDDQTEAIIGRSTVPIRSSLIKWEIRNGLRGLIQGALLAKTKALYEVGGYRKQFVLAEESDLFLRLSERFNFINSPEYLYKIRIRPNSLSLKTPDENIWYALYALDCTTRRKSGQSEQIYEEFRKSAGFYTRLKHCRERWLLHYWRENMASSKFTSMLLAGMADPCRVISRILRSLDSWIYKKVSIQKRKI